MNSWRRAIAIWAVYEVVYLALLFTVGFTAAMFAEMAPWN